MGYELAFLDMAKLAGWINKTEGFGHLERRNIGKG
jgi:hypothetical protein